MSLLDATIVTGDIWSKGALSFESPLKDLLDSGEYTLEQLLNEDELLQELRGVHPKLIEFFSNETAVVGLIQHLMGSSSDREQVRFPYMACEVICCEIQGILDALVDGVHEDKRILDLLFSWLYTADALDDYQAGYLDKILSVLFRRKPRQMTLYINSGGERGRLSLMQAFFNHLYSHSIMQILQRLLLPRGPQPPPPNSTGSTDNDDEEEEEEEVFSCDWSTSNDALHLLVQALIQPKDLWTCQNAAAILITIVQNSPLTSPTLFTLTTDPVLQQLVEAASVGEFTPHDTTLTCAIGVLETIVLQLGGYGSVGTVLPAEGDDIAPNTAKRRTSRQDLANPMVLDQHLPKLLERMSTFLKWPEADSWTSSMQFSNEPQRILGTSRLRIVRLLESLVLLGDLQVDLMLCKSDCLEVCLDLFWKFQWCAMLHQSVANLLVHVFEGANDRIELQMYFINNCGLLARLMDSFWEEGLRRHVVIQELRMPTSSTHSERGSIAVSDDDAVKVEDDLEDVVRLSLQDEEEAMNETASNNEQISTEALPPGESREASTTGGAFDSVAPAQAFRLGYMGHVIIICQALVHACTGKTGATPLPSIQSQSVSADTAEGSKPNDEPSSVADTESAAETEVTGMTGKNPIVLAQLVDEHPLKSRWEEFVTTTLVTETTIQSTPLGGYNMGASVADLLGQRPGLADDGGPIDDDGAAPPLPPRGLLVGGDGIDMDDNDLEIAAAMMAGLSTGRTTDDFGKGGLAAGLRALQTGRANYMFDDPLGEGRFDQFADDDDSSSSEEEDSADSGSALQDGVRVHSHSSDDVPVMDLFAGNFAIGGGDSDTGTWSNFANFDDAFAAVNEPSETKDVPQISTESENGEVKDLFSAKVDPATLLLEEPENAAKVLMEDKLLAERLPKRPQPEDVEDDELESTTSRDRKQDIRPVDDKPKSNSPERPGPEANTEVETREPTKPGIPVVQEDQVYVNEPPLARPVPERESSKPEIRPEALAESHIQGSESYSTDPGEEAKMDKGD